MAEDELKEPLAPSGPVAEFPLQLGLPRTDEVIADMGLGGSAFEAGPGQFHRAAGDVPLVGDRPLGDRLDGPAVAVPCGEVLARIDLRRVALEDGLDRVAPLEEGVPVE